MIISHTIYHSFVLPCTTYKLENYIQFFLASFVYINQIIHENSLQYPPLHKWLNNLTCFRTLSNHFWTHPLILATQITQVYYLWNAQYMGNCWKHLLWPILLPINKVQALWGPSHPCACVITSLVSLGTSNTWWFRHRSL